MKRLLSAVLVLVMVFAIIPLGAVTASAETTSGTTGDCTWTLVDGVLTISGNGAMGDYCDDDYYEFNERLEPDVTCERPWGSNDNVKKIVIHDGVIDIGEHIFFGCNNLETVEISDTVQTIHKGAFYACDNLKTIYLGSGIKGIQSMAFMTAYLTEDYNITDIYYNGTIFEKENIVIHSSNFYGTETWHYINEAWLLEDIDGNWYYYENGIKTDITTLVKYKDKWFYIKNGKWCKDTTLVKYNGKRFYVKNGVVDFDFSGKVKIDNKTYEIKDGKVVTGSKSETASKTDNTSKPNVSNEPQTDTESTVLPEKETPDQQQSTDSEVDDSNNKKENSKQGIIILTSIIVIVLLCGGAVVLYFKRKRKYGVN